MYNLASTVEVVVEFMLSNSGRPVLFASRISNMVSLTVAKSTNCNSERKKEYSLLLNIQTYHNNGIILMRM